jgi:UDP-glucose 4-epimerase
MKLNQKNYFKGKKVLITGGLGFIGSNLAHQLVRQGAQVTLLDTLLSGHGGNPFNIDGIKKEVDWIKGDIRNENLLNRLLKNQEFLFNIAAQTSHTDSMKNPFLDTDINNRGQLLILETCKKINPTIRIVYCSTRAIYGSQPKRTINEESHPNPLDIYSVDKLSGEYYHKIYSKVFGLKTVILRLANAYGPRAQMKEPSFGILNWFMRLAIDGEQIRIFGDGKQIRDYLFVDDAIEAFLTAAKSNFINGEVFNIGSGKGIPLINIVKKTVQIAGKGKIVYVPWPNTNKKIDVGDFIADIRKIKSKLGWHSKTDLETGLQKTIEFYKQYKNHYW